MKWYTPILVSTLLLCSSSWADSELDYILDSMGDLSAYEVEADELKNAETKVVDDSNPLELDQVTVSQSASYDFTTTEYADEAADQSSDSDDYFEDNYPTPEVENSRSPAILGEPEPIPVFDSFESF